MVRAGAASTTQRVVGWLLLAVGVAVFAIRLQHAGPYALPGGGNLLAGVLALALGALLAWGPTATGGLGAALRWTGLAASPLVLFFALYAALAEVEEVVVLKATHPSGEPSDLRLWIVDHDGAAWVTMGRAKAEAHGLERTRAELLRRGETRCVLATRVEERAAVNEVHRLRHEKYAVQRLATAIGLFGRTARGDVVALRLEPCPEAEQESRTGPPGTPAPPQGDPDRRR